MSNKRQIFIALAMVGISLLAYFITPDKKVFHERNMLDLESMVPKTFGLWKIDPTAIAMISPEIDKNRQLGNIYNQVLMRTYVNDSNERVMFTIAYGGDQSDSMQLHRPEVCYVFQGFKITREFEDAIKIGGVDLQIKRLIAVNGRRSEPITYWIKIGDKVVADRIGRKLEQLKYGLTGKIPDGMLLRVSNISKNEADSFKLHEKFINDLYDKLGEKLRTRIVGRK